MFFILAHLQEEAEAGVKKVEGAGERVQVVLSKAYITD